MTPVKTRDKYIHSTLPHVGECWMDVAGKRGKGKRYKLAITYEQAKQIVKELREFIEMYEETKRREAIEALEVLFR